MAAKQATVIDHISGGRFILNIVTGWNKPEIDMFGVEMLPHDQMVKLCWETPGSRGRTSAMNFSGSRSASYIRFAILRSRPITPR